MEPISEQSITTGHHMPLILALDTGNHLRASQTTLGSASSPPPPETPQDVIDLTSPELLYSSLDKTEKWGLDGYMELAYSLATVSKIKTETESSLWDIHSPNLVSALYRAVTDTAASPLKPVLIAAFENCKRAFARHYDWREECLSDIFAPQTIGRSALVEILDLIKLAKEYGTVGEQWWELKRRLCVAFFEAFENHGLVARDATMFQRLFRESLYIFRGVGSSPAAWTYMLLRDLKEWRSAKEAQEGVAVERMKARDQERRTAEEAWETLKEAVGTVRMGSLHTNALDHPFQQSPYEQPPSPGSRMREAERRKPLQHLQQRLAPNTPRYTTPLPLQSGQHSHPPPALRYSESVPARPPNIPCEPYVSGDGTLPFTPQSVETGLTSPASSSRRGSVSMSAATTSVSNASTSTNFSWESIAMPTPPNTGTQQGATVREVRARAEPMDIDPPTNSPASYDDTQALLDANVDEVCRLMDVSDEEEFWESFTTAIK